MYQSVIRKKNNTTLIKILKRLQGHHISLINKNYTELFTCTVFLVIFLKYNMRLIRMRTLRGQRVENEL